MTIKAVMNIGTSGMTKAEKAAEQERRMKVVDRINKIGEMKTRLQVSINALPDNSPAKKIFQKKLKEQDRNLRRIKGDENRWLKSAAWFLY